MEAPALPAPGNFNILALCVLDTMQKSNFASFIFLLQSSFPAKSGIL